MAPSLPLISDLARAAWMFCSSWCLISSPSRCLLWSVSSPSKLWPSWRPSVSSVSTPGPRKRGERGDRGRHHSRAELLFYKYFTNIKKKVAKWSDQISSADYEFTRFFYPKEAPSVFLLKKGRQRIHTLNIETTPLGLASRYTHQHQQP